MKRLFLFIAVIILVANMVFLNDSHASEKRATNVIVVPFASLIKQEKILTGHSGWVGAVVGAVAFSPDGRLLASGNDDGLLILWDVVTGAKIRILEQPSKHGKAKNNTLGEHLFDDSIMSVSFSPEGKILASGKGDGTITLWEVTNGKKIVNFAASPQLFDIAYSPDGKTLASIGKSHFIVFWDIAARKKIKTVAATLDNNASIRYVTFSPDGKLLAGRASNNTIIIDLKHGYTKRILKSFLADEYTINEVTFDTYSSIAFSPDSKLLASGSKNRTLVLLDVATGNAIKTFIGHSDAIQKVAFSPDGKVLASLSKDATIILWDVISGNKIKTLTSHSTEIESITFGPNGKIMASSDSDGTILLWDTTGVYLSGIFQKSEFETTKEYEQRLSRTEIPYTTAITLGKYDADRSFFEAELAGVKFFVSSPKEKVAVVPYGSPSTLDKYDFNGELTGIKFFIYVPREKASMLADRKDKLYLEGKLRYYNGENVELVNATVVDDVSKERFAVLKTLEGPATAYVPKPATKEKPVENIHDIPDFKSLPRKDDIAIVIGVENYQSLPKSDFSRSDAGIVKDYLKALGFQERNIEFLTDERATKSGIEKAIEAWLPNKTKKGSNVIVYYSGHGSPEPTTGEAYIVPFDGDPNYLSVTGYPLKRLYDKLSKLQASEVVVVIDSCFSGAGGRSVLAKGARPLVLMTDVPIVSSNIAVLSATQRTQISMSSPEKGHGVFTYYFLKALKDGKKDVAAIYEYIKPLVEDEAKTLNVQQSPSISPDLERVKGRFGLIK